MTATGSLQIIRRLALAVAVLSFLLVPLGVIGLANGLSPDIGDSGLGDAIAFGVGIVLVVAGALGVILGMALARSAKRASVDPEEVRGIRRGIIVAGLIVACVQILVAALIGGGWLLSAVVVAAFAIGYLTVAVTARSRGVALVAGIVAVVLFVLGAVPLVGQASMIDSSGRRDARVALLPSDWPVALDSAAAAAPHGWAVATLTARVTDFSPTEYGAILPPAMTGQALRGIIVVDCAGSEQLQPEARDPSVPTADARQVPGTVLCEPEPGTLSIEIPSTALVADPAGTYVLGISMAPVTEHTTGGMNRAVLFVALADAPDPERSALVAAFVAAFGTETPR